MHQHYIAGEWNVICDQCGRKYKASALRKRWDGLMVCNDDWETRHPQELVRTVQDSKPLPWTRPEPTDAEVAVTYDSSVTSQPHFTIPDGTFNQDLD